MPYRERLNPWVLIHLLPKRQRETVAQYHDRSDADGHLQIIRRLTPDAKFEVVLNPDLPQPSPSQNPTSGQ